MTVASSELQVLTFYLGDERFAAPASSVTEVLRRPKITRVPGSPASLLGLTGYRGAPTPVLSLARLLGKEDSWSDRSRLLLLSGRQPVGLAVDDVGALSAITLDADDEASLSEGFGRLFADDGGALRALDLDKLIRRDFAGLGSGRRIEAKAVEPDAVLTEEHVAVLSFQLAEQTYGLLLDEIDEVLPRPAAISEVAQSHEAAIGVINLRDQLLPIVSLRRLLGLNPTLESGGKVLIVRVGLSRVGLIVDQLNAILRVPLSTFDTAPAALNRGAGTAQVETICRLADGRGLVAILSAKRLFDDDLTAQILADGRAISAVAPTRERNAMTERFVIFRLGAEEYGLPLGAVDEIVRLPEKLTRVPNAPAFIEGVLNLRGKVTPVIDQRRRFAAVGGDTATPRIIITSVEGRQAGFIVDAVSEILPLNADQMEQTSSLTAEAGRLFSRVASLSDGERLILLVEPKELLDRAERDLLADLDASQAAT